MKSNNKGNLILLLSGAAVCLLARLCVALCVTGSWLYRNREILRGTRRRWSYSTSHPAFCLIIKQKYCLFHQKIVKSLFFVLTCDAYAHTFWMDSGHAAFSSNSIYSKATLTHFSSKGLSAGWEVCLCCAFQFFAEPKSYTLVALLQHRHQWIMLGPRWTRVVLWSLY